MTITLLYSGQDYEFADASEDEDDAWIHPRDVSRLGWTLEPEGMCQGERCVPLPAALKDVDESGRLNFTGFARYLEMPVLRHRESNTWSIGGEPPPPFPSPAKLAPDFTLPGLDGVSHSLSQYRGRKIFLVSWASW